MNTSSNSRIAAALWVTVLVLPLALSGCMESGETTAAEAPDGPAGRMHSGEAGHEDGRGEQGHTEEALVNLTPAEIDEFGIKLRTAGPEIIELSRSLPGEVTLNPDRVAHVTPRVPGVASGVRVIVGDQVKEGEVMAVLVSRELAQAKSAYLAALSRLDLAEANFRRAEDLWRQEITAEADYLAARQALEETRVNARLAERELYTLGLSEKQVASLTEQLEQNLARYELTAPIGGEVIERHITEGEVVPDNPAEPPFVVADLSNVWVQLTVYPKDLAAVRPGQEVVITPKEGGQKAVGTITYVSPIVGEATRTATARVVLDNAKGRWKPGLFVTGRVRIDELSAEVVVPKSALQTMEGQTVVFVHTPEGFEARPVKVGRTDANSAQIVSGLAPGQRYAANAFILMAGLREGSFQGHSH
ncbi:MAG: efflux RND transporter periplasmic adaptor subunit [Nitrococcus sp.]|nr:efflux RND transporter periplasmic adaptor subunit [Nitrococcus sp.]